MGEGARLGVHSAYNAEGYDNAASSVMADFLTELTAAPLDIIYTMTMTPGDRMWFLPRERWSELRISEWTAPLN